MCARPPRALDGVIFTGALPHDQMPACLAACDFGVAPFDPETHPALSLGFYWSPLKIFEYMASGLPVVAPAIDRIPKLVGHNREGLLYDTAIRSGLPHAFEALTDVDLRRRSDEPRANAPSATTAGRRIAARLERP